MSSNPLDEYLSSGINNFVRAAIEAAKNRPPPATLLERLDRAAEEEDRRRSLIRSGISHEHDFGPNLFAISAHHLRTLIRTGKDALSSADDVSRFALGVAIEGAEQ